MILNDNLHNATEAAANAVDSFLRVTPAHYIDKSYRRANAYGERTEGFPVSGDHLTKIGAK